VPDEVLGFPGKAAQHPLDITKENPAPIGEKLSKTQCSLNSEVIAGRMV
jgi:hypothetical protein